MNVLSWCCDEIYKYELKSVCMCKWVRDLARPKWRLVQQTKLWKSTISKEYGVLIFLEFLELPNFLEFIEHLDIARVLKFSRNPCNSKQVKNECMDIQYFRKSQQVKNEGMGIQYCSKTYKYSRCSMISKTYWNYIYHF